MRKLRIIIGILVCLTALAAPWLCLETPADAQGDAKDRPGPSLWRYWTGQRRTLVLRFSRATDVAIGDPIFVQNGGPLQPIFLERVGEIQALFADGKLLHEQRAAVVEAKALIYPSLPPLGEGVRISYRTKPDSVAWVIGALMTPENKAKATEEFGRLLVEYRAEITAAFRPVIENSLRAVIRVIEEDTPAAIARHQAELETLGAKYRRDLIDRELMPLVREEVWPAVRVKAEPALSEVGQELWQHISLWRFSWRLAYDMSPLPEKKLTDQEWKRFVENDAMPILQKHSDQFVGIIRDVIGDLSRNERIQTTARDVLATLVDDAELREIVRQIFHEVVIANPRLWQALDQQWSSPEAKEAIRLASSRLEPAVRRVGDMMFGTQAAGITPEFAQVLRTEILDKDHRWFLLELPPPDNGKPSLPKDKTTERELPVEYGTR